jgi:hypothetical protein
MRRRQAAHPLKGLEGAGLLSEVGRQTWHDLRLPGLSSQGEPWERDKTAGIMVWDQHGALLKMGVIVS